MKKKNLLLAAVTIFSFVTATLAQTIPSYVPTNGLVGWWPFNGNANDESGNGNNGVVNGASLTGDRFNNPNKAYSFNGVNNKITVAHSSSLNVTSSMTFSIWFKQSSMGNTINYILQKGSGGDCATTGYYCGIDYGFGSIPNGVKVLGYGQGTNCSAIGTDDVLNSAWHHMAIVYNPSGNNKLYLDGQIANPNYSSCNNCTIQNSTTSLIIGGYFSPLGASDKNWNGQLDDIGIWNRALTPCEIQQLYYSGISLVSATSLSNVLCSGDSTTLSASGAASYSWAPGNLSGSTVTVSPTANTTYTVTGTDANGCVNTATTSVNVNTLPQVNATATSNSICIGSSATLQSSGALSYAWSPGNLNGDSVIVSPTANTIYTVTGTNANGCVNTATASVNVNALPQVNATTTSNSICIGSSATLQASGALSYTWAPGNLSGDSLSVSPTANTTYTVTGTDANGCENTTAISITVNPLPQISVSSSASTFCITDANGNLIGSPSPGVWSGTGVSGTTFSPASAGAGTHTVVYTFTDANGCSNSDSLLMTVNLCTGLNESTAEENAFQLFPNPVHDQVNIIFSRDGVTTLSLRDMEGRKVGVYAVNSKNAVLDLCNLSDGIYFIFINEESRPASKLVKH